MTPQDASSHRARLVAHLVGPGWPMRTGLDRDAPGAFALFGKVVGLFAISAAAGARTSIYLASAPEVAQISGGYFAKCRSATSSTLSHDAAAAGRLWEFSAQLCGL
jgi:retinol dehydrogenase 12